MGIDPKKRLHLFNLYGKKFSRAFLLNTSFSMIILRRCIVPIRRSSTIVGALAILAIIISCLGLFGLASYSAEKRIKEVGIRKVLGASVQNIVVMLSKDFLKYVLIAIVIAWPLSWFAVHKWLQDYAYRINISWWMFVMAGSLAMLIALVTISFQAIKAAIANPVKSLRTE